jgi:hypothetical protein
MSVDYASLRRENKRRYGTDIGRIGDMLLANRYDKRTHFIFELLQNTEDALRRRKSWTRSKEVVFELLDSELRVSHFGQPFDEADVRGICGIDESTKDITSIGRFGIGFKSVYAFTKQPEIHSGAENFAIESYVWPVGVRALKRDADKTVIVLPLKDKDDDSRAELVQGLEHLGARALLFLRHVKEISWTVEGGSSGLYLRDDPIPLDENVRELTLMGQQKGKPVEEERWLVFSRGVHHEGKLVGHAEIAFTLSTNQATGSQAIQPLPESPLVVFFPTVLQTHLGFLVQGPYRTTPSRDNVPPNDRWNQELVGQTGEMLVDALRWLTTQDRLDVGVLRALPLEHAKFTDGLLAPLFAKVADALKTEPLLPTSEGSYTAAVDARLSRTQDLRDLFQPTQLAALLGADSSISWLAADITADRTPELRQYLMRELAVPEATPESLLPRLSKAFLEAQSDDWVVRLYDFLGNVPAVLPRLANVPLVRLESGTHVPAFIGGHAQAFLPSDANTEFPTIRHSVCAQPQSKKFLQSLGLTEPDPVDDVIRNLLPRYVGELPPPASYDSDITRILRAFGTDSKAQKEKLIAALQQTPFVVASDLGEGSSRIEIPGNVYLAAARLKELFSDIAGIYIVDDSYAAMRGDDVRELLEACGATRYIYPTEVASTLSENEKRDLRRDAGHVKATYEYPIEDYDLVGLEQLLNQLLTLEAPIKAKKAELLWEALIELLDRRGQRVFSASYNWQYISVYSASFDSLFLRRLNNTAWIPDSDGELQPPSFFLFESLGWRPNPFLQSKILFKKPIVEELAREVGIEPAVLDMLKKLGLTRMTELMARLKIDEPSNGAPGDETPSQPDKVNEPDGVTNGRTSLASDGRESVEDDKGVRGFEDGGDQRPEDRDDSHDPERDESQMLGRGGSVSGGRNSRLHLRDRGETRFVSYVAAHPDDDEDDPDGLSHAERLALEQEAINLVCSREQQLTVMPAGNKGFDLIETDAVGDPERWIEIKAMKGSLRDRPVGLSQVQFEFARQHGEQYWLYVVEHAGDPSQSRILKIQDPAGRTGTFTFDRGWENIADVEEPLPTTSVIALLD